MDRRHQFPDGHRVDAAVGGIPVDPPVDPDLAPTCGDEHVAVAGAADRWDPEARRADRVLVAGVGQRTRWVHLAERLLDGPGSLLRRQAPDLSELAAGDRPDQVDTLPEPEPEGDLACVDGAGLLVVPPMRAPPQAATPTRVVASV